MISIVIPALNEESGIGELYSRITTAVLSWPKPLHEFILVDDGSTDRTLAMCRELALKDPRFRVVSLTRNFGHQAALTAGLAHVTGSIVVVMDADLQDPPESVGPLIAKLDEGFDVVYAIRTKRKEGFSKRAAYFLYYRLLRSLATLEIPLDSGDFCVMRGEVLQAIQALPERNRFIRGLRTWVGFRQIGMKYERSARFSGEPKITWSKMIAFGLDGIVNFSAKPLHIAMIAGGVVGGLAVGLSGVVILQYAFDLTLLGYNPRHVPGWTSLILVLLLMSATQLFCIGILSEYIGRLFEESKRRPVFLVRERINIGPPENGLGMR